MAKDRIYELLSKFFKGECTFDEKAELALWVDIFQDEEDFFLQLRKVWAEYEPDEKMEKARAKAILEDILREQEEQSAVVSKSPSTRIQIWRWSAAAVIA